MEVALVGRDDLLDALVTCCRARQGAVLVGPAGVGKSRLLREATSALRPSAWSVERFVASEATQPIPFGPMISLLDADVPEGAAALLAAVRHRLLERAGSRPLVLAIDDAHLLDDVSFALLNDLASQQEAVLLLSARSGQEMTTHVTSLWTGGLVERLDVGPLDAAGTTQLVAGLLGDCVDPALVQALVSASGGNPLLLREVVADACASGTIAERGGTWCLVDELAAGPRIQDLVSARAGRLDSGQREVLELVAVGEPLDVRLLGATEASHLDVLEALGLVELQDTDGCLAASTHHPMVGEAMRDLLPTRRRREILRDLAERLSTSAARRHGDALRAARWWMESGTDVPPELATVAAREALSVLDLDLAADLATAALHEGATCEPLLVLGDVRRLEGRPHDAEQALERAAALAEDDEQRFRIATLRAYVRVHQLGRPAEAIELLEQVADDLADPDLALQLHRAAMSFSGMLGRYADVLRSARRLLSGDGLDPEVTWNATHNAVYAQVMISELSDLEDSIARCMDLARRLEIAPEIVDLLWALRAGAWVQEGELVEAQRTIGSHLSRCRSSDDIHGTTAAIRLVALFYLASPELFDELDALQEELERRDPFGVRPIAAGTAALAHARCGWPAEAAGWLDAVDLDLPDPRARPFVARGHAALLAATGRVDDAVDLVVDRGLEAIASSHVAFGAVALHDAAVYGRPDLVADALAQALPSSAGRMLRELAAHAASARDGDGKALDLSASRFAEMSAPFLAATAWAQAAGAHESLRLARRSAALHAIWSRAAAPFSASDAPPVDGGLSQRQLEIAVSAAAGEPSRAIAERLYLSVRTVENHLQGVYEKLEVRGREELADALSPLPRPGRRPNTE